MRVFKPKYKRKGRWVDVKKRCVEVRNRRDREENAEQYCASVDWGKW